MLFADLLRAAVPNPVTCLGLRLRPLSLGSLLLLYRFENAFAIRIPVRNSDAQLTPLELATIPLGDLLQAVIACSLPFQEAQDALAAPDLAADMKLWGRKLRGRWPRRLSLKQYAAGIEQAKASFATYFKAGLAYPYTRFECTPRNPVGSPWPMLTLTALMDDLHQDFHTAVNQPLALSRWLVASNAERKGLVEIVEREEVLNLQAEADAIAKEVMGEKKEAAHGPA